MTAPNGKPPMKLDDLLHETSEWLKGTGPQSEIIMSSRVRLGRNIWKKPFSHWANQEQAEELLMLVKPAVTAVPHMKGGLFLRVKGLTEVERQFLIERHLVSREHAVNAEHKAVAISDREVVSIMINEEDHIRLQVIQSGFNLAEAWRLSSAIDDVLAQRLEFAHDDQLGYLTACPTNTGTGMRASVMAHLPSLVMTRQINKVLQAITKLGLTARGFYGEGTQASGNLFQISNQVTLGHSEEEIVDNIERIIRQVIEHEQNARQVLLKKERPSFSDRIWRAFGTLQHARIISSSETTDLLSMVRLGVDLGLIKTLDRRVVNDLFIVTQPAHLQKIEGKALSPEERDVKRAELIRERLKGANGKEQ